MTKKKIKDVRITPGCISCGSCEAICPKVFEVKGTSRVKEDADLNESPDLIEEAARICPVNVIKVYNDKEE
jgi:ferredoxin